MEASASHLRWRRQSCSRSWADNECRGDSTTRFGKRGRSTHTCWRRSHRLMRGQHRGYGTDARRGCCDHRTWYSGISGSWWARSSAAIRANAVRSRRCRVIHHPTRVAAATPAATARATMRADPEVRIVAASSARLSMNAADAAVSHGLRPTVASAFVIAEAAAAIITVTQARHDALVLAYAKGCIPGLLAWSMNAECTVREKHQGRTQESSPLPLTPTPRPRDERACRRTRPRPSSAAQGGARHGAAGRCRTSATSTRPPAPGKSRRQVT